MIRTLLCFVALTQLQLALASAVLGQVSQSLYLGAGKPGTQSFELGVGVTSLIKVRLLPYEGIDLTLVETAGDDAVGDLLITDQQQLADLTGWEPVTQSQKTDLRSVMTFKPSNADAAQPLELIARADVPEDAVYFVTKSILENALFLEDLNQQSWDLTADQALRGLNLPLHPGAIRYYEEIGEANLTARNVNLEKPEAGDQASIPHDDNIFYLKFASDAALLDLEAKRQIAEACQYAAVFDAPEIRVASRRLTESNGRLGANGSLISERMRYVLSALRSNAGCARTLDIIESHHPVSSSMADDQIELIVMLPQ